VWQGAAEFIVKVRKGVYDKRNSMPVVNIEQINIIMEKAAARHAEMIKTIIEV